MPSTTATPRRRITREVSEDGGVRGHAAHTRSKTAAAKQTAQHAALATGRDGVDRFSSLRAFGRSIVTTGAYAAGTFLTALALQIAPSWANGGEGGGDGGGESGGGESSGGSASGGASSGRPGSAAPAGGGSRTSYGPVVVGGGAGSTTNGLPVTPYKPGVPYASGQSGITAPSRAIYPTGTANPLIAGLVGLEAGEVLSQPLPVRPYGVWGMDPYDTDNFYNASAGDTSEAPGCQMANVDANQVLVGGAEQYIEDDEYDNLFNGTDANTTDFYAYEQIHASLLQGQLNLTALPDDLLNATALHNACVATPHHGLSNGAIAGIVLGSTFGTFAAIYALLCCCLPRKRPHHPRNIELT